MGALFGGVRPYTMHVMLAKGGIFNKHKISQKNDNDCIMADHQVRLVQGSIQLVIGLIPHCTGCPRKSGYERMSPYLKTYFVHVLVTMIS